MKYQSVIFDLDGTILDTLADLAASVSFALAQNDLPTRTLSEVRSFVGNGIRNLIERSVPQGTPNALVDQVHKDFTAHYSAHCADATRPYPGILPLLQQLRQDGVQTAVVSNKADYAVQSLVKHYFPGLIDFPSGERAGVRKKPAPDTVFEALAHFSCPAESAVYVGDSEVDIATAKNAGTPCIIVDWGFRQHDELAAQGAPVIVSSPEQLLKALTE